MKKKENISQGIFNLSSKVLSAQENQVLSKVLSFAPTNKLSKFSAFVNAEKCIR